MDTAAVSNLLGFGEFVAKVNNEGVDHEKSLVHPDAGGNCMNWIMGHITHARGQALALLGAEPLWPADKYERYKRGSHALADKAEAIEFSEVLDDFFAIQKPLTDALATAAPELLNEPVGGSPTGNPDETVGSMLVALGFHEAYHLGQIGVLRRLLGMPGAIK